MLKIARGLEADGILNGAGREKWHTSNINQILRNEKYIGDALLHEGTQWMIQIHWVPFYFAYQKSP